MLIIPNFNTIGSNAARGGGSAPPFEYTAIDNNYSMTFDGASDYIDCGDSNDLSFGNGTTDSPFSISAWVKMTDVTNSSILSKTNVSPTHYEYSAHFNSEQIYFGIYSQNSTSNYLFVNYSTNLTSFQGSWIHLTFTYDGSSNINGLKIYLNATRVDDAQLTSGTYVAMNNTVAPLKIGRSFNNRYLNGAMDEVAVFNTALSLETIEKIYNTRNDNPGKVADLSETPEGAPLAWYRFE